MNRRLVISNEGARHPFRKGLPARVLRPLPQPEPEVLQAMAERERADALLSWTSGTAGFTVPEIEAGLIEGSPEPGRAIPEQSPTARQWRIGWNDLRDFTLAYFACFIAVSAYIA